MPQASPLFRSATESVRESTPTNRERPPNFRRRMRKSFVRIQQRGNSSRLGRPGIAEPPPTGSLARKEKRPDESAWPPSSRILPINEPYQLSRAPRKRTNRRISRRHHA